MHIIGIGRSLGAILHAVARMMPVLDAADTSGNDNSRGRYRIIDADVIDKVNMNII